MTHPTSFNDRRLGDKFAMTVREAATYFSIGENKIRQIVKDNPDAKLTVMSGNRVLIKRKAFETFLDGCECV